VILAEDEAARSQKKNKNASTTMAVATAECDHPASHSDSLWWKHASVFKTCGNKHNEQDGGDDNWYDACHDKCTAEIRRYKNAKSSLEGDMTSDINILEWWKQNKEEYPILWKLAQVFLAIPATARPSEQSFSIAGNIVTARRNRLSPELVEASHLLHENAWLVREKRNALFCPKESKLNGEHFFTLDDIIGSENNE